MKNTRDMTVETPRQIYEMLDWKRVELCEILDCINELKPGVTSPKQDHIVATRDGLNRAVISIENLMEMYAKDF